MTPEQTLLTRIVDNNPDDKLLALLMKADGLSLGTGELDQGELDVLRELKPVKPEVVYDLEAMNFNPNRQMETSIDGAHFRWAETLEGGTYWVREHSRPTQEGRDKIAAMREQFERENK